MVSATSQYWQYMYVLSAGGATRDSNGSWTAGSMEWTLWSACREETNGRGSRITTQDGKSLEFSSLVQLPVGTERVGEGTRVLVANSQIDPSALTEDYIRKASADGLIRIDGECLKFDSGRLHCRLWI